MQGGMAVASIDLCIVGAGAAGLAAGIFAAEQNRQEAIEIVKGMAKYVGGQKNIDIEYDSALEVVSPQLEKLQFNSSGEAKISRPDQFRVSRTGGYADVELIYDGKSVTYGSDAELATAASDIERRIAALEKPGRRILRPYAVKDL